MIRTITTLVVAALLMLALAVPAFAAIERDADTRGGGGDPQGGGRGLIVECENKNGKAPNGQNDPDKC